MRAPLALMFILLCSSSYADPLSVKDEDGKPAVIGNGQSETTVSIIGGSQSATVAGQGDFAVHTNSGTASANGSLGVPQANGATANGSAAVGSSTSAQNTTETAGGWSDAVGGSAADSGDARTPGNTSSDGASSSGKVAKVDTSGSDVCVLIEGQTATLLAIALIVDPDKVQIAQACDEQRGLKPATRDAIRQNVVLQSVLSDANLSVDDVLQIRSIGARAALLYVR